LRILDDPGFRAWARSARSWCRGDLQVRDVASLPGSHPEPDSTSGSLAEILDHQARGRRAVDVDAHLGFLDDDARMEPAVAVGRGDDRLLELTGFLFAQHLPTILRVRDVLDGVDLPHRVLGAKVERPEVDRIVRLLVHDAEGDSE